MSTVVNGVIPEDIVANASNIEVFDSKGTKKTFGELIAATKTIVVFIRHFFCGTCKSYVEQLTRVPDDSLREANVKIILIGCGEWQPIETYKKDTGFLGEIYANPDLSLFYAFGMTVKSLARTPSGEERRSYVPSFFHNLATSLWTGPLKHPLLIGKQGNHSQLGGDFIFGPGNVCSFAHTMKHTEDHVEVVDLMKAAGVDYSKPT